MNQRWRWVALVTALGCELLAYLLIREQWSVQWPGIPGSLILGPPLLLALTDDPWDGLIVSLCFFPIVYEFRNLSPLVPISHQIATVFLWCGLVFTAAWFRSHRRDRASLLISLLVSAEVKARQEVAMELHDDAVQALTAARLMMDAVSVDCKRDPGYQRAVGLVVGAIQRVRMMSFTLNPRSLEEGGLKPALTALIEARRLDLEPMGTQLILDIGHVQRYENQIEQLAYRTFVEAIQNVYKHAAAKRVTVTLREVRGCVEGSVTDDGRGFDQARLSTPILSGMGVEARHREVDLAGGQFVIQARPNEGTRVWFKLPARVRKT